MLLRPTLALLLLASSLGAAVVDRTPLTGPMSELVPAGPGRVVASQTGLFLLHGQRIDPTGEVLDPEPVPAADGYAVSWSDGWRVVNSHDERLTVRRLGVSGSAEVVQTLPASGRLLGVASHADRLAILEYDWHTRSIVLKVSDGTGLVAQVSLGVLDGGAIASFGEGFLVVSFYRSAQSNWDIDGWLFTSDGELVRRARIEQVHSYLDQGAVDVATAGNRALVTVRTAFYSRLRVIASDLSSTGVHDLVDPTGTDVSHLVPIATEGGWFVSYTYMHYPGVEYRALLLSRDGAALEDLSADPVVSADRVGDRFLVVRPWGDAAIAEGDPRTVVSPAIQLRRRVWEPWTNVEAVVSGEVTLVTFGRYGRDWFVLIDAEGRPLDPAPQRRPSSTIASTPSGFAFAWRDGATIRLRRLARTGDWLDTESMVLADVGSALGFDLAVGNHDMLLAWSTDTEIRWARFTLDGVPMQSEPDRVPHAPRAVYSGTPSAVSILTRGDDRLILVQDTFICTILCETPDMKLEAVAVDADGSVIGAPSHLESHGLAGGVGLADGSWVVSSSSGLVRFDRDGSLLEISSPVDPSGMPSDMTATADGWRGVFGHPQRIVDMRGTGTPSRVTGLSGIAPVALTPGDRIVFLDGDPDIEFVQVPWTGRLSAAEGDLSLRVADLGGNPSARRYRVTVRNEGRAKAASSYVLTNASYRRLSEEPVVVPPLLPGEAHVFETTIAHPSPGLRIHVLSDDLADTNPSDNAVLVEDAELPRRHPARR